MYEKFKNESYALLGGINSKASPYVNGPMEFRDISNMNFFIPGALTKRPGSTLYLGATVQGRVTGGVEFERLNGSSYLILSANTNVYSVASGAWNAIRAGVLDNALFDFAPLVDRLFCANGQDFFKTEGTNTSLYSLPDGQNIGLTRLQQAGGYSGIFVAGYGYFNDRGYFGPASAGITITMDGVTFGKFAYLGLTTPSGYGISGMILYVSSPGGVDLFGITTMPAGFTHTFTVGALGTSLLPFPLTTRAAPDYIWSTLVPKYIDVYNNQLMQSGFSSLPSTLVWSDVGEPEGVEPTFRAEFRTNDGDRIRGHRPYNGSFIVAKERSVHRLSGDDPNGFLLQEISDQYGCISNRAMVVFENKLWFLDSKGIVEYDGANIQVVSNKVEPLFKRMNIDAAKENAWAFHYKDYNEVWFGIPVDGSSAINLVVVYDYAANAWTRYSGVEAATIFLARGNLGAKTPFFGGYTGNLFYFGASFYGDNGRSITCTTDSYFLASNGQTQERLYRRYYLNVNPITGITQPIDVSFQLNYGSTIALTRTMYQNPYQSRLDFGLPGRAIQASNIHASASLPYTIFGFAFISRFQRDV